MKHEAFLFHHRTDEHMVYLALIQLLEIKQYMNNVRKNIYEYMNDEYKIEIEVLVMETNPKTPLLRWRNMKMEVWKLKTLV